MRRVGVAIVLIVFAVGLALSGVLGGTAGEPEASTVPEDQLIDPGGEYQLWPFTSRSESVDGRTLAINVVFRGDPDETRRALVERGEQDWEEMDEEEADADPEMVSDMVTTDWDDAHGSTRYSYFERDGEGQWVDESYQLHAGTYLGSRYHIRAYEAPDGNYTAVQVHQEYYDWFRLRHTVTDISESARLVEDDFIAADAVVTREHRGIEGGWSDGWISVIELVVALPLAGAVLHRRTRNALTDAGSQLLAETRRHENALVLGAALAGLYLAVRAAGVGLEVAYPSLPPKSLAVPLYLLLALGLPATVIAVADRAMPVPAFAATAVGLATGFLLDFASLGVAVPPDLVVHRVAIAAALGLVAAGRADADRRLLVAGLAAWTLGLVLPLADML